MGSNRFKYFRNLAGVSIILIVTALFSGCGNKKEADAQTASVTTLNSKSRKTTVMNISSIDEFDRTLTDNTIVLADFYADWCGPCHMLKPKINEIAEEYDKDIKVVAVDIDKFRSLADRFGVNAIPDVRIFKHAKVERSFTGVQPKENYTKALDRLINN